MADRLPSIRRRSGLGWLLAQPRCLLATYRLLRRYNPPLVSAAAALRLAVATAPWRLSR